MKEKGNNEKNIGSLVIAVILLILIVIFYYVLISSKNEILELVAIGISSFFLLANIYYIIKNQSIMKKSKKMVKKINLENISKNPLEVYLISAIWNHRKITIGDGQVASSLLYEISEEHVVFDNEQFSISSDLDIEKLSKCQKYIFYTVFLDSISNQQNEETKLNKIRKMQKEKTLVPLVVASENIKSNLHNRDNVHNLTIQVRDEYFETVENDFTALLSLLTIGVALLNLIEAITFMKVAAIENFYIPVILAFLLVFTITSKSRERVLLKEEKVEEITRVLNYIHLLSKNLGKAKDKVYLCSLGLLSKEEREQMISLFQIE